MTTKHAREPGIRESMRHEWVANPLKFGRACDVVFGEPDKTRRQQSPTGKLRETCCTEKATCP